MQRIADLEPGETIQYHILTLDPSNECPALGRVTYEEIEAELGEFTYLDTSIEVVGPGIWTSMNVDVLITVCNVDTGACYNPDPICDRSGTGSLGTVPGLPSPT